MNQGPAVTPGMHFGPYEGEVTSREDAMASRFSWEASLTRGKMEKKTWTCLILLPNVAYFTGDAIE